MKLLANFLLIVCPCIFLRAQPVIDGDLSDVQYQTLGWANTNNGFSLGNDIGAIKYYSNSTTLYIGVTGTVDAAIPVNNIVIFLDDVSYLGRGNNTLAGTTSSGGVGVFAFPFTCLGMSTLDAGFDADYAFAFNKGNTTTNMYFDAMRFGAGAGFEYLQYGNVGFCNLTGTSTSQNLPFCDVPPGCTPGLPVTYAFLDGYVVAPSATQNNGIEIAIPYTSLPGVQEGHEVRFFVVITNQVGQMSNECIPGDLGTTSPLTCPVDISTISGETFYTTAGIFLPISFIDLTGKYQNNECLIQWFVAEDSKVSYYLLERSADGNRFTPIKRINGRQLMDIATYTATDDSPMKGKNYYRIQAVGRGGEKKNSSIVSVNNFNTETVTIFPNPVKGVLNIEMAGLEKGNYNLLIVNTVGQVVLRHQLFYKGVENYVTIRLPEQLTNGFYNLTIKGHRAVYNQKLFIDK